MHDAIAHKFTVFQSRDHADHLALGRPCQVCLEAYYIIEAGLSIILSQLYDRIRAGISQSETYRLERTEQQGLSAPLCHDFKRHASFKIDFLLKVTDLHGFRSDQSGIKPIELIFCHRTVDVVG